MANAAHLSAPVMPPVLWSLMFGPLVIEIGAGGAKLSVICFVEVARLVLLDIEKCLFAEEMVRVRQNAFSSA
jgi:hypothetical protein